MGTGCVVQGLLVGTGCVVQSLVGTSVPGLSSNNGGGESLGPRLLAVCGARPSRGYYM